MGSALANHVRAVNHLLQSEATLRIEAKHTVNEVTQLLRSREGTAIARRNFDAIFPKQVGTTVVIVFKNGICLDALAFSDWDASQDHEQDATEGENISCEGVVGFATCNFRGHVARSADVCLQVALLVSSLGRSEVSNLDLEVFIKQNILHLQITMSEAFLMNVLDTGQDGAEDEADASVGDLRLTNDNVKEFSTHNVVEDQEVAGIGLATVGGIEDGTLAVVVHFNDVSVVEFAVGGQLFIETISGVGLKHFNSVGLAILLALVDNAV